MRKFGKRLIEVSMVAIFAFGMVACGNDKENNNNSDKENAPVAEQTATTEEATTEEEDVTVLTVLTTDAHLVDTKYQEYKTTFEADHEGVEIRFEAIANYDREVTKRLENGTAADVMLIPKNLEISQLPQYFEPIGTVEELSESYREAYLYEKAVDGQVYGLPRYMNVYGVAYNEIVMAKAGTTTLPTTSEEFLGMLRRVHNTQPEVIPYYTGYGNGEWLHLWQNNVWGAVTADADYRNNGIVAEVDPFTTDKPNYVVHELLYDVVSFELCEKFNDGKSKKQQFRLLNRGEIGCMMLSSDYLYELQNADVNPDDISFMPFPYNVEGQQYATVEADYSYAINVNSENKELAQEWITYLLKKSGFAKSEGAISIKKSDALPDVLKNFENVEFVVINAATADNAGKYDELNRLSGIYLDEDVEKERIIQAARGKSGETFEDIMLDWNTRWQNALNGIQYEEVGATGFEPATS
ncbi:MAG: extracellular solute-binding protein [Lachnospiraceae bacterium]|nr:extracellular solute-binding protein [Lachnospiraceae bacterium]